MRSIGLDLGRWADAGTVAHPLRPADAVRPGDAPGADAQADRRVPAAGRGGRSDQQLHLGGHDVGSGGHADAPGRFPQEPGDHQPVHQPDPRAAATSEETDVGISSIIDTWLLLRDAERDGERSGVDLRPQVAGHGALEARSWVSGSPTTASSWPRPPRPTGRTGIPPRTGRRTR